MYVRVHKEGNQWFRDDGTLVGKEVVSTNSFNRKCQYIIQTADTLYFKAIYGYINNLKQFVPLCMAICNPQVCEIHNTDICFYFHENDATVGYYVFSV